MNPSVRRSISTPLVLFAGMFLACTIQAQSPRPGNLGPNQQAAVDQAGHPDLNGVWAAPFVPDISKALGHQPPFTPYGAERWKNVQEADDPLAQCLPIGPARGIQAGLMPFQLIQTPGVIGILFENQRTFRLIYTDGRAHPKDPDLTWFGDSIAAWEGNTLVIDVTNFSPKMDFRGSRENLHLVERWTRTGATTVDFRITIEDPTVWTRPWTVRQTFTKQNEKENRIYYEPRCYEGNYALAAMLLGARQQELAFAEGRGPNPAAITAPQGEGSDEVNPLGQQGGGQ